MRAPGTIHRPTSAIRLAVTLLLVPVTTAAVADTAGAQGARAPTRFTVWGTVAPLSAPSDMGAGAVTAQISHLVLSLRLAVGGTSCSSECGPSHTDVGVLAGYGIRAGGPFHAYAAAGLALANSANDDASIGNFLAIPLQVEVAWRPLKFLGLGVMVFESLGTGDGDSFGAVSLAVQLGKVR